jgi:hypothetical protein
MTIGDIAILEHGLETQAREIEDIEREAPSSGASAIPARSPGRPLTAQEDRALGIQQYEQQHSRQPTGQTSAQRLASMGITVNTKE